LHEPEQQSLLREHASPVSRQVGVWHDGSAEHAGSVQSAPLAQSSSMPFEHTSGPTVQSMAQSAQDSSPSQTRSPQQYEPGTAGTVVHWNPPEVHRASAQPTGFEPSPSPQQYRLDGLPLWTPAQSDGQDTQSSPSPASQMPLPQTAPLEVPDGQSDGQLVQSSPASHTPSLSQVVHPVHADVSKPPQSASHASVPPVQLKSAQVRPPRSVPSHASPGSVVSFPHTEGVPATRPAA
jgi:hypothetical protein